MFFRMFIIGIAAFLLTLPGCVSPVPGRPVVVANGEELHGRRVETGEMVVAFKGIPFAAPPVGDLRWRAPQDHQPRPGPQQATEFAPACMQTRYMTDWYADVIGYFEPGSAQAARPVSVNEDCLYLNVWSALPRSDAKLPVMVWVHGGSNRGGWSYEPNYLGTKLAAKGVVVVTISYRLGAFGFFSHPALGNGEGEPVANFGLLDIHQASLWVQDNIAAFGGDPNNITLFGESAGAGNISDLLATDLPGGPIYQKVILQSSASGMGERRTLADEQALGQKMLEGLGIEANSTPEALRDIPAEKLLNEYMTGLPGHYFNAVVDQTTMKRSPLERLQGLDRANLDVMIGTNADEWLMYVDENANQDDLEEMILQMAPDNPSLLRAEISGLTDPRRAIDRIQTAESMLCPSRFLAGRVSAQGGRSFVYHFSRNRPGPGGEKLGAYHGTEIPYVFGMHDDWLPVDDIDRELTEAVMDYWVQFALSGNPNLPHLPQWPVYSSQKPMVMELGDTIGAIKPDNAGLCDLLGPN